MGKHIDHTTLNWVKQEIDETLSQARHALEEYVGNPGDATQLRFCLTYIHQVYGTLQMVELYGAALFAEEMEQLVQSLLDNKVSQKQDAYEILMQSIVQFPDYLERIQAGLLDNPLVLLPLLNDLRAARGEHLLSENALFSPNISSAEPILIEKKDSDTIITGTSDMQTRIRKLRHQYQIGLLGWFRDRNTRGSFESIADVLGQLERICTHEEVIRLWWVGSGLVEALLEGGINSSVSLKLLLGHLDREIKRLIENNEQDLANNPSEELLKNLLFYVARSSSSGSRVTKIKEKFNLIDALPAQEDIDSARASISGPNAQMMETVTGAIREDLVNVKDVLDLHLRSDNPDMESLEPQVEVLRKTADTLGMLGLGVPRKIVQEQAEIIRNIINDNKGANEADLMKIASSLLYVESSLDGLSEPGAVRQIQAEEEFQAAQEEDPGHQLPLSEIQQIQNIVLKEVGIDIAHAKDAITSFIDAPMDHILLENVPGILDQARGGLQMISEEHAASLLNSVNRYILLELVEKKGRPDQSSMDALAVIISSIEYYLETILEGRFSQPDILISAHEALEVLGYKVDMPGELLSQKQQEPEVVPPLKQLEERPSDSAEPSEETTVELSVEKDNEDILPENIMEDEIVQANVVGFHEGNVTSLQEEPVQPSLQVELNDEIDEDILEIFIEEANEELGVINEILPKWKNNYEDHESLSRIRRAFHTMKGSGRMVGAVVIGELAWSLENMVNRVIDNTIPISDDMVALIDKAVAIMPGLVNQLQGENGPDQEEIQSIVGHAFSLVDSEKSDVVKTRLKDNIQEEAEDLLPLPMFEEEPGEANLEPGTMDPALHGIFSKESDNHLENIHGFIDRCQKNKEHCIISDALVRALHTLHGSARMAGANNIAEMGGLLEKYIKVLMGNNTPLSEDGLTVLADGIAAIEEMLNLINKPDIEPGDYSELLGKLDILYSTELQGQRNRLQQEYETAVKEHIDEEVDAEQAEYDDEILEVFLEEGSELLDSSEIILQKWRGDTLNKDYVSELQREIHTLKGGARMAGIAAVGDLSHGMESLLTAIVEGEREITDGLINTLHKTLDSLFGMLQRTQERQSIEPANELIDELGLLLQGKEPVAEGKVKEKKEQPEKPEEIAPAAEQKPELEVEEVAEKIEKEFVPDTMIELPFPTKPVEAPAKVGSVWESKEKAPQEMVRVRADLLDNLVNYAGEVSIYRSRLEQQIGAFGFNLVELEQTVLRLREQLRKLEIETETQILFRYEETGTGGQEESFDPLELDRYSQIQQLSRSLMESSGDIASIQGILDNQVRETETLLLQQARVNTDLQEGLMRTRMVSFTRLAPRLQRIVRQTCQELGKKARIDLIGEHGEMDRSVLERITAPLEHMLRNAVSHGIELPDERKERGKAETGDIGLSISREASDIVIVVSDDGRGIDLEAVRKKAIESGLMDKSANLTDKEIMQFVLESGFSTAKEVTQISGRGVGMDVVNSEIKQLGGSLHIDSTFEQGTTFTIRLPFTLAINHALLVNVGDDTYAIPLTSVEGIVRMTNKELEHFYSDEKARYPYAGQEYKVENLSELLGFSANRHLSGKKIFPVLLIRTGDHHTAVQVDGLMGSREIVVKSVGPQISTLRGVSGATILGDGRVVLILDINSIIRISGSIREGSHVYEPVEAEVESSQVNIMVVDDSITVRKVTTRLLERNNMKVITAKDGVDAVAVLDEHIPDVMLLDIEMPRMDGYELATYMRNDARLKEIPIIMITSRTGDKHRRRAEEIGVNRYMGKPYQESDLLENIEQLLQNKNDDS